MLRHAGIRRATLRVARERVPTLHGFPTLSLISLESNGAPRNYHRPDDTPEDLDMSMVVRAADFGAAVILAALRGDADPISTR